MPPKVEPLTNVDAAWLGMEDPTNLMMVSGILTFDEPINMDHLRAVLKYRFLKFERWLHYWLLPDLKMCYRGSWQLADSSVRAHKYSRPSKPGVPATTPNGFLVFVVFDCLLVPLPTMISWFYGIIRDGFPRSFHGYS